MISVIFLEFAHHHLSILAGVKRVKILEAPEGDVVLFVVDTWQLCGEIEYSDQRYWPAETDGHAWTGGGTQCRDTSPGQALTMPQQGTCTLQSGPATPPVCSRYEKGKALAIGERKHHVAEGQIEKVIWSSACMQLHEVMHQSENV